MALSLSAPVPTHCYICAFEWQTVLTMCSNCKHLLMFYTSLKKAVLRKIFMYSFKLQTYSQQWNTTKLFFLENDSIRFAIDDQILQYFMAILSLVIHQHQLQRRSDRIPLDSIWSYSDRTIEWKTVAIMCFNDLLMFYPTLQRGKPLKCSE